MFDNGSFLRRRKRYKRPLKGVMSSYPSQPAEPVDYMQRLGGLPPLPPFLMPSGQFRIMPPAFHLPHSAALPAPLFNIPSLPSPTLQPSPSANNGAMRSLIKEGKVLERTKFTIDNIIGSNSNKEKNQQISPSIDSAESHLLAASHAAGFPMLPIHWAALQRLQSQFRWPVAHSAQPPQFGQPNYNF